MTNHTPSVAAGNSAPGGEDLLRSLAGTATADGTDLLGTREDAAGWLRGAGLLPGDGVLSGSEHGALLRLRDALRDVLAVRASGSSDGDAAARLTRALADGRLVVTVSAGGAAGLASSARASYSNLVAAVAIAVAQALLYPRVSARMRDGRGNVSGRLSLYTEQTPNFDERRILRSEMSTVALTEDNFEQTVTEQGITLVDWWAAWCGPCRAFGPVFEAASEQHGDITFGKIDTEDQQGLAAAAQITSIPTLMAFRDGVLVFSQAGALPAASLEKLIQAVRDLDMEQVRSEIAAQQGA